MTECGNKIWLQVISVKYFHSVIRLVLISVKLFYYFSWKVFGLWQELLMFNRFLRYVPGSFNSARFLCNNWCFVDLKAIAQKIFVAWRTIIICYHGKNERFDTQIWDTLIGMVLSFRIPSKLEQLGKTLFLCLWSLNRTYWHQVQPSGLSEIPEKNARRPCPLQGFNQISMSIQC